jgi:FAD binding domain-containing protein
VSIIVAILGEFGVPFAIRSGGHSFLSGASNINGKISIDLSRMNAVKLADDNRSVHVQPGATWAEVYKAIEPHNLTVVGGRAGAVGVGGLVLGGGSSWHSNRYGWVCDSVQEFEVVVFGTVLRASHRENQEVFWALKGGGNNFGIVTALRLATVHQGDLLLSTRDYSQGQLTDVLVALEEFTDNAPNDLDTSLIMSFLPAKNRKGIQIGLGIVNVNNNHNASGLKHFSNLPDSGRHTSSMKQSELADLANQVQDRGSRKIKFSITVHNKVVVLDKLVSTFKNFCSTLEPETVVGPYLTFQPLTTSHIRGRDNALGLSNVAQPLILVSLEMYWTTAEKSDIFHEAARDVHDAMSRHAELLAMLHPFVFLNYAASWQKPFDGYGREYHRLKSVQESLQRKYDPDNIFNDLIPGGHKLFPAHWQCNDVDGTLR